MANFKNNLLFDYLANILKTKSLEIYEKHVNDEEEFKSFQKYMVLKYLSMSPNASVRNIILQYYVTLERMPNKILYKFLIDNIPKQYNTFIKFIR